ncbi:MAG: hypothetical protein GY861_12140 [bacterium]|nr:hypothetical protein [bacterium]
MSEKKLPIATLGTRETAIKVTATLAVTQGADTTTNLAVVFEKPFVNIPDVIGVVCTDVAGIKANFTADTISKTGMNVKAYQVLAADLVTGSYDVEVSLVGWVAA